MKAWRNFSTYRRLGWINLLRGARYRGLLRLGVHPVQKVKRNLGGERFFVRPAQLMEGLAPPEDWQDSVSYFGWYCHKLESSCPAWYQNPFRNRECRFTAALWWEIPDFRLDVGDIKTIWELSRFDWVLRYAQRAASGSNHELEKLNRWMADWCQHNPAFNGPNWKCGQEASIRVMHLLLAARILGQEKNPTPDLVALIEAHLARISPTLDYALAQDNNHGTSEAAAMFLGGVFCFRSGLDAGARWSHIGRRWLEERVERLIGQDGSFSQYSLNYHRLLLDTLSCAEMGRRWFNEPPFSSTFYTRAAAAAGWLFQHVDPISGDGPNLGDNDGANLLPLTNADYRDFRPSVQLGMAMFNSSSAFSVSGSHMEHLEWLGIEEPQERVSLPSTGHFPTGGNVALRNGGWSIFFKYPHYSFRPRHCDALHLDIWYKGLNLSGDAGTFSYNAEPPLQDYFQSTKAHNTVAFDDHDQMPRVGRFLRGNWLEAEAIRSEDVPGEGIAFQAAYTDHENCQHYRRVQVGHETVEILDRVQGFRKFAVLRWRLFPGKWTLDGNALVGSGFVLSWSTDIPLNRVEIVEGYRSRYYLKKELVPVLEIELSEPGEITSNFRVTGPDLSG